MREKDAPPAGNGAPNPGVTGDGGPARDAEIGRPTGIAVAPDGSLYIADVLKHVVRRVGPDGIIHTVAGIANSSGFVGDGGPATSAKLFAPFRVVPTKDGSFYIADGNNRAIRRVSPTGVISTIAGLGIFNGFFGDGGRARAAVLGIPNGLAIGPDGSIFTAERTNGRVRRIFSPLRGASLLAAKDGREAYDLDPEGRHLATRHTLTGGTLLEFGYSSGRLVTITDGDGKVTTIERDGSGNPTAIVAHFGQRTTLTLDPNGYLASITDPAGQPTSFRYTTDGLITEMTDARTNSYTFHYDAEGRLDRDDDPADGFKTLSRTEDPDGFSVTLASALGRETSYAVENLADGDQSRLETDPAGLETTTLIGADGTTLRTTPDGTSIETAEVGDPRFGMLAPVTDTETVTTPGGLVLTTTTERSASLSDPDDPLSLTQEIETVEINDRPFTKTFSAGPPASTTTTSAEDRETISTLDSQGRVTKTQLTGANPVLYPTRRSYDASGRLSTIKHGPDPDTAETRITTFTYKSTADDQNGLLDTITDPAGRETQFEYDDAGRVTTQTFLPGTPDEREIVYAYDPNGNLSSITPPGKPTHTFDYTEVNLEKEYEPPPVSPADPKTTYAYNEDRQLTDILRPGGETVVFDYDPDNGRLESLTLPSVPGPGSEERNYTYDMDTGNLTTLTGPDATLSFGYDGSLLTSEQWTDGAVTTTVSRDYDDDFQLESLQVNAETPIAFTYDDDGLLTSAGALTPITRHQDYGFVTATALGTVTDAWTYSPFGELESYEAEVGGNSEYAAQYTHDELGRIATKNETIGGVTTLYEYEYDPAGRLYRVKEDGNLVSEYTYDQNGNRTGGFTQLTGTILSTTYDDQDRLTEYVTTLGGTTTYAYTENGELETKTDARGTTTYAYDALGNLRSVVLPGPPTTTIEYLVDGRTRRIGKKVNGSVVQRWVYKDQLEPVAELDGAGNLVAQFVYGTRANVPDYMVKYGPDAGTYRILSDHLGSPRLVINSADESVAQRLDYDEFGTVALVSGSLGFQPFSFAGGLYDPATGLVRFGARDYEPETGRWTAKDPIRFGGGHSNLFGYAMNNPINLVDETGRDPSMAGLDLIGELTAQAAGASLDFLLNYIAMMQAYTKGSDAYFHCKANCEATMRGPGGEAAAEVLSELREVVDENDPFYPDAPHQCDKDRVVNAFGRDEANHAPTSSCQRICAPMRPPTLAPIHW